MSQGSERDFEKLSRAITEAVMSSEKVKKIAAEIQKNEEICPDSFMVLVLKLQFLTDSIDLDVEDISERTKKKSKRSKKKNAERTQFIDGHKLTKREIEFQEFDRKRFNAEEWLKKNGLIL